MSVEDLWIANTHADLVQVWVRDYTSIGSVLPSSRSVIEGTTRTQRTSHTSNRLAYSRSDASSQSRGAGTASSVKGAVARQGRELSLLKGAVKSVCYWTRVPSLPVFGCLVGSPVVCPPYSLAAAVSEQTADVWF